ncbi:hypothetical protein Tco_0900662 [Tanacetum coccineum]
MSSYLCLYCRVFPPKWVNSHDQWMIKRCQLTNQVKIELENGFDRESSHQKKMKLGNSNVKKVAEMVLVLSVMAKIRGRWRPSNVELEMMNQAKEKLGIIRGRLRPSNKLGIAKLSFSERMQVTKQKVVVV